MFDTTSQNLPIGSLLLNKFIFTGGNYLYLFALKELNSTTITHELSVWLTL
mgnify:FL=1